MKANPASQGRPTPPGSPHRAGALAAIAAIAAMAASPAAADTDLLPEGYSLALARSGSDVANITQMAFRPGDLGHVFAARALGNNARVSRYDYDPLTGLLSNEVAVVANPDNRQIVGIAFHGDDLYVTFDYGGSRTSRPGDGRIARFRDIDGDGFHELRHDIVHGINKGSHGLGHLQVRGDSLFAGIGAVGRKGDPAEENLYSCTVAFIGDLTQVSTVAGEIGGDFKGPLNHLAGEDDWLDPDGPTHLLRYFASGFRNPFGIAFDPDGDLWVTVNGNSDEGFLSDDFIYRKVGYGDMGEFPLQYPGQEQPFARHIMGTPITHLVNLGVSPSPGGLDFILEGPDAGKALVGQLGATNDNQLGRDLLLVDPESGAWERIYRFEPDPLPSGRDSYAISDVVRDPFGRFLVPDFGHSRVLRLETPLPTPRLRGVVSGGKVGLTWPLTGIDWTLESSPSLEEESWEEVEEPVELNESGVSVEVPQAGAWQFFRLRR